MRTILKMVGGSVVGSAFLLVAGCPSHIPDLCDDGACEQADSGSDSAVPADSGSDAFVPPADCDMSTEPKVTPKCVVESVGVFVSATGSDDAEGTKAAPVKSLAKASELAALRTRPRVYVCEGKYEANQEIKSGVAVYGGFKCGDWSPAETRTQIAPAKGIALRIAKVLGKVLVSDLDVVGTADSASPGDSAIAAFVSESEDVTFQHVSLTSGDGVKGSDGASLVDFETRAPDGVSGTNGGDAKTNLECPASVGGAGGGEASANGGDGVPGIEPPYPTVNENGSGGDGTKICAGPAAGRNGSYGVGGLAGASSGGVGRLTAAGWIPASGADGQAGGNAQGGGGGARVATGGKGGGGGAGGCGGAGGGKGGGGGASIALLIFNSAVNLQDTTLTTHKAGNGGKGGTGQKGQLGSNNFAPPNNASACSGGVGGVGGSGAGGGGGAGGVSVGVFYKGQPPKFDGVAKSAADDLPNVTRGPEGTAGPNGPGGEAAQADPLSRAGAPGAAGQPGDSKAVMSPP